MSHAEGHGLHGGHTAGAAPSSLLSDERKPVVAGKLRPKETDCSIYQGTQVEGRACFGVSAQEAVDNSEGALLCERKQLQCTAARWFLFCVFK